MAKVYIAPETTIEWSDSGNTPDENMDMGGLSASGGVVMGEYHDLGAGPRADIYEVEFFVDGLGTGTVSVGETIDILISQSNDTTGFDGQPSVAPTSSSEGTITLDQATNAMPIGTVSAFDATEANNLIQGRFVIRLTGRYVAPIVINRTGAAFNASGDHHFFKLTPIPADIQVA